jgi:Holliday junction resolvasome RuvABC endonuclease subunit
VSYIYPKHIRALALDMATTTGYAILIKGEVRGGAFKVARKKGRRHLADEHEGKEYADFQEWLERLMRNTQPQHVFYEMPGMFKNPTSSYKAFAFRGFLMAECSRLNVPLYGYATTTIKKAATGSGRTSGKQPMIDAAKARFPDLEIVDDNMADALHVLSYGLAARCGIETLDFGG